MDFLLQPAPLWLTAALFAYVVSLVFYLNSRSQQRLNEQERRLDNLTQQHSDAPQQLHSKSQHDDGGTD